MNIEALRSRMAAAVINAIPDVSQQPSPGRLLVARLSELEEWLRRLDAWDSFAEFWEITVRDGTYYSAGEEVTP